MLEQHVHVVQCVFGFEPVCLHALGETQVQNVLAESRHGSIEQTLWHLALAKLAATQVYVYTINIHSTKCGLLLSNIMALLMINLCCVVTCHKYLHLYFHCFNILYRTNEVHSSMNTVSLITAKRYGKHY